MKNTASTKTKSDRNAKTSLSSRSTYFAGAWLREFLPANYQFVGKTFSMKNICICIDKIFDLKEVDDDSVAYRITDTDLSIRAVFTATALLNVNDSLGPDSEEFSEPMLAQSPIVLEECRLLHLTVPGTMFGDFVLEVHSFTWTSTKNCSSSHVNEILHLAPQYVWCSEDPELQTIVKKVYNKRCGGILSVYSVTENLDLMMEGFFLNCKTRNNLFIPPEICEEYGLYNPGSYNGKIIPNERAQKSEHTNGSNDFKSGSSEPPSKGVSVLQSHEQQLKAGELKTNGDIELINTEIQNTESEKVTTLTTDKSLSENQASNSNVPLALQSFLLGNSYWSSPEMQPKVKIKPMDKSLILFLNSDMEAPVNKNSFFVKSKRTLSRSAKKSSLSNKSPVKKNPSNKSPVKKNPSNKSPVKKNPKNKEFESSVFDPVLNTQLTESQIAKPLTDSLQVLLSEGDIKSTPTYKYHSEVSESSRQELDDGTCSTKDDPNPLIRVPRKQSIQSVRSKKNKLLKVVSPEMIQSHVSESCCQELNHDTCNTKAGQSSLIKVPSKQSIQSARCKKNKLLKELSPEKKGNISCNSKKHNRKAQKASGSDYQDAFSQWLMGSSKNNQELEELDVNETLTNSATSIESKEGKTSVNEEKATNITPLKSSMHKLSTEDKQKSPVPRVVLSSLPTDVNLKASESIKSINDTEHCKIDSGSAAPTTDPKSASTTDSNVKFVTKNPQNAMNSSNTGVRFAKKQSGIQAKRENNLKEQVAPVNKKLLPSTPASKLSTKTNQLSVETGVQDIQPLKSIHLLRNALKNSSSETNSNRTSRPMNKHLKKSVSSSPLKRNTLRKGSSCSSKDSPKRKASDSSENLSKKQCLEQTLSRTDAGPGVASGTTELKKVTNKDRQVPARATPEVTSCSCDLWKYPDNLLSSLWKLIQSSKV